MPFSSLRRQPVSRRQLAQRLLGIGELGVSSRAPASRTAMALPPLSFESHLLARATFGGNKDIADNLARVGPSAWLDQQLNPASIDDTAVERIITTVIKASDNRAADIRMLARALYSRRQLAWRMVYFLNNHFATFRGRTTGISETKEDEAFYADCFGGFGKALQTSAKSPAMIDFLDSGSNIAGNPNENYAREVLELHTVGVDGGYNEPDVAQLARVFTGWSRTNINSGGTTFDSYFTFRANVHDAGAKSLTLGWSTPGISGPNGYIEGYEVLRFLAAHPKTATRFTGKLCRYFVSDDPPAGLLARVEQEFIASAGNMGRTVRAIFLDPEFHLVSTERSKVQDGFEMVVNVLRRFYKGAVIDLIAVNDRIGRLRSQPHQFQVPTGYPEIGGPWQGPGQLLPRWEFADDYAYDRIPGTPVPWATLFPTLPTSGFGWATGLLDWLVDGQVPASTVSLLTIFMNNRLAPLPANPPWAAVRPHARALLALILQLPEVQIH